MKLALWLLLQFTGPEPQPTAPGPEPAVKADTVSDCRDAALPAFFESAAVPHAGDRVELRREAAGWHLLLWSPDGATLAEQQFPAADCDSLRHAVAVTLQVWLIQLQGPPLLPEGSRLVRPPSAAPAPISPAHPPVPVWLGLGLLASLDETAAVPAGELMLDWRGWWAAFLLEWQRSAPLGRGEGRWQRLALATGPAPQWSLPLRSPFSGQNCALQLRADVLGSITFLSGAGFSFNQVTPVADYALEAGVRLWLPGRALAWWVAASALWWPRRQVIEVEGVAPVLNLPEFESLIGVGLSLDISAR